MLRNAVPWVEPNGAVHNVVLPLWMMVLGVALRRHRGRGAGGVQTPAVAPA